MKRRKLKPPQQQSLPPEDKTEEDSGFEASHGYGAGHGGPSGPGDVPGDQAPLGPATRIPTPAEDEKDD
jgi:hypothetical protein